MSKGAGGDVECIESPTTWAELMRVRTERQMQSVPRYHDEPAPHLLIWFQELCMWISIIIAIEWMANWFCLDWCQLKRRNNEIISFCNLHILSSSWYHQVTHLWIPRSLNIFLPPQTHKSRQSHPTSHLIHSMADDHERSTSSAYPPPPSFYKHFTVDNINRLRSIQEQHSQSQTQDRPQQQDADSQTESPTQQFPSPSSLIPSSIPDDLAVLIPPKPPTSGAYTSFGDRWNVSRLCHTFAVLWAVLLLSTRWSNDPSATRFQSNSRP